MAVEPVFHRTFRSCALLVVLVVALSAGLVPAARAQPVGDVNRCPAGFVALTFDDGPGVNTGRILDVLAAEGAHATFFVNGPPASKAPDLISRAHREGHVIGNHTWGHEMLTYLSDARILSTVRRLEVAIEALGVPILPVVRPPFMGTSTRVRTVLEGAGYRHVLWTVDPQDWRGYSATTVSRHVIARLAPGAIVLFHDGGTGGWNTLGALPGILAAMEDRGFCTGVLDDRGRVVAPVDPEATVFAREVALLFEAGVTRGCGDGRFCPHQTVTRGQMASFLVRSLRYLGIELVSPKVNWFRDDDGSIHEDDIDQLAGMGIARGYGDGSFGPEDPVTRAQAASFMVRAFGYPPSSEDWFSDDGGTVHEAEINALAAAGITVGCGNGRFCPDRPLPRDEMAVFLVRVLGLYG